MTIRSTRLMAWQQELHANCLWGTMDNEGHITNYYESKEAAELEMAWRRKHMLKWEKRMRIVPIHVHTLKLAQERWVEED